MTIFIRIIYNLRVSPRNHNSDSTTVLCGAHSALHIHVNILYRVYMNVQDIMIQYSLSLIYVTTHDYVTGWTTDQSQLCSKYEQEIFLLFKVHRSVTGLTRLLFNRN